MTDQMPTPEEDRTWTIFIVSFLSTIFFSVGAIGVVDVTDNLRPLDDLTIWPALLAPLSSYLIVKLCKDMKQGAIRQSFQAFLLGACVPISGLLGRTITYEFFEGAPNLIPYCGYWIGPLILLFVFAAQIKQKK